MILLPTDRSVDDRIPEIESLLIGDIWLFDYDSYECGVNSLVPKDQGSRLTHYIPEPFTNRCNIKPIPENQRELVLNQIRW